MIIVLNSIVNIIYLFFLGGGGNLYDRLTSMRIFTLIIYKIFLWTPKTMRKVATTSNLDFLATSYRLRVRKSGLVGKIKQNNHLSPIYLKSRNYHDGALLQWLPKSTLHITAPNYTAPQLYNAYPVNPNFIVLIYFHTMTVKLVIWHFLGLNLSYDRGRQHACVMQPTCVSEEKGKKLEKILKVCLNRLSAIPELFLYHLRNLSISSKTWIEILLLS